MISRNIFYLKTYIIITYFLDKTWHGYIRYEIYNLQKTEGIHDFCTTVNISKVKGISI